MRERNDAEKNTERQRKMSEAGKKIQGIRTFWNEVVAELKKCSWPTRQELFDSTIVVILSVALLGGFIALCDVVLRAAVRLVFRA